MGGVCGGYNYDNINNIKVELQSYSVNSTLLGIQHNKNKTLIIIIMIIMIILITLKLNCNHIQ
jgi:hypothetical protein